MIEQEFMNKNRQEQDEIKRKLAAKNPDIEPLLAQHGFTIEYDRDNDYLYMTIGNPREGMAVHVMEFVAMADPDTLELVGLEIPFFMEKIRDKKLGNGWVHIATWVGRLGSLFVPPAKEFEEASKQIEKDLQPSLI